jgi:hypothetical protein
MIWRTLAAALTAAVALGGATAASAADLYSDNGSVKDRYGAYEDPRYADVYRHPEPPPPEPRYYRYSEKPPIPREPVYRDDYYRPHAPPRYAEAHPYQPPHRRACLSRQEAGNVLLRDGWRDFHEADVIDNSTAVVKARRPDGRMFALRVDRCTGEIVNARPLGEGPYAGGPRRWERWN